MRRDYLDLGFTVLLLALMSWMTWEASKWDARARLFPWAAGIPVVVLLVIQLARRVRSVMMTADSTAIFTDEGVDAHVAFQRTLRIAGWILGFAFVIWAIGFAIGGTLATMVYLKTAAREKWPMAIGVTAGTAAFFWLMSTYLHVPIPPGFIIDMLPS